VFLIFSILVEFFPLGSEYAHGRSVSGASGVSNSGFDIGFLKSRDSENILQSYERFLKAIHGLYFRYLNVHDKLSDVRFLVEQIRSQILHDVNLAFSGVFPKEIPFHRNREVVIATEYGASVSEDLTDDSNVTHLICARKNTEKHKKAHSMGIRSVSPKWLWSCIFHFHKVPEELFAVEAEIRSEFFCPTEEQISVVEVVEKTSVYLDEMYGVSYSASSGKRKRNDQMTKAEYEASDDFADLDELEALGSDAEEEEDEFADLEQEIDQALEDELQDLDED
jgi:hypothetical protein